MLPLEPISTVPRAPLEVGFRRLLLKCETAAAGAEDWWKSDPVFHSYVDTLQEQLSDMSASSIVDLEPELMAKYEEHVAALRRALGPPNLPAYCRPVSKLERLGNAARASGNSDASPCGRGSEIRSQTATAAAMFSERAAGAALQEESRDPSILATNDLSGRMEMHGNLQDDLIDDMAGLAQGLKEQTKAVEEHLRRRRTVVDAAEDGLTKSVSTLTKNAALAGKVEQSSRSMTCTMFLVLIGVMVAFLGMAVFIKFTSIAGYRVLPRPSEPKAPHGGEL